MVNNSRNHLLTVHTDKSRNQPLTFQITDSWDQQPTGHINKNRNQPMTFQINNRQLKSAT